MVPLMVQKIFETIRMVSAEGVTILLVEMNYCPSQSFATRNSRYSRSSSEPFSGCQS